MDSRIIHGDCNIVMSEMDNDSVDLIVTDIPYGISFKSGMQKYENRSSKCIKKRDKSYFREIVGDSEMPTEWLIQAYRVLKNNCAIYVFCHWSKWHLLYPAVINAGFAVKNMVVMNKSNHGMGDLKGQYAPKHELLLYATKGRHLLNYTRRESDIWTVPVKFSGAHRLHPNEKPMQWILPCILNSSRVGDVVLDPFAGSGSTGEIAKSLDRQYILIEIDPEYIEIIKQRISASKLLF